MTVLAAAAAMRERKRATFILEKFCGW
jgi:hypothetical protein